VKRFPSKILLTALFLLLSACITTTTQKQIELNNLKSLITEWDNLTEATEVTEKEAEVGDALDEFIARYSTAAIDDQTVDMLASLTDNPQKSLFAVLFLGKIGPRAESAVPSLERALEAEWEKRQLKENNPPVTIYVGVQLVDVICHTLPKITLEDASKNTICAEMDRRRSPSKKP
jgi:hypothetical protein